MFHTASVGWRKQSVHLLGWISLPGGKTVTEGGLTVWVEQDFEAACFIGMGVVQRQVMTTSRNKTKNNGLFLTQPSATPTLLFNIIRLCDISGVTSEDSDGLLNVGSCLSNNSEGRFPAPEVWCGWNRQIRHYTWETFTGRRDCRKAQTDTPSAA